MAYETCLKRQATTHGKEPVYPLCSGCEQGIKVKNMFPKINIAQIKRFNHIALKPGSGRKRGKKGSSKRQAAEPENKTVNLYDLELILKAQILHYGTCS